MNPVHEAGFAAFLAQALAAMACGVAAVACAVLALLRRPRGARMAMVVTLLGTALMLFFTASVVDSLTAAITMAIERGDFGPKEIVRVVFAREIAGWYVGAKSHGELGLFAAAVILAFAAPFWWFGGRRRDFVSSMALSAAELLAMLAVAAGEVAVFVASA